MINKIFPTPEAALADVPDGATVMISGFGGAGMPAELIDCLIAQGARELTIVNNNAGNGDTGLAALIGAGRVRKILCSFPRQADSWHFDKLYRAGKLELELVPQGTLAERIRAAGAGIGAFFTPTAFGTRLAEGKETRHIDGRDYVLEYPIHADYALIKADRADRWGNLSYRKTARNFGPIMAAAAKCTVVQVRETVELGELDPETVIYTGNIRKAGYKVTLMKKLDRKQMAARLAQDIPEGAYVNLGIGLPTLVADYLPKGREIILHSENGVLGIGPRPPEGEEDEDLINAGKEPVTLLAGGSFFHHADSFGMIRGRHLDFCVLGAFQVSASGDLANWHTGAPEAIPAVGGAMDLAVGAKQVLVMMEHLTKEGASKLVERCSYPLTGARCVNRVYTDLAVIDVKSDGFHLVEIVADISFSELQRLNGVPLQYRAAA